MSHGLDLPVLLLSHRGPVTFSGGPHGRTASRGAGGLVTALTGLLAHLEGTVWICMATGEDAEVAAEHPEGRLRVSREGEPRVLAEDEDSPALHLRLVEVDPEVHAQFYGTIANPLLWFVQHRLYGLATHPEIGRAERRAWDEGYVEANRIAADAVVAEVERLPHRAGTRAAVFLHDYHFYLVGQLVRERCPDVLLSHFVHIPWPGPHSWSVLPPSMREPILWGLLGCDVVGFHTELDARSFLLCVQELLGLPVDLDGLFVDIGERRVRARSYPISIDVDSLEEVAYSDAAEDHMATLPPDGQLVLRVDRTDPSKNIVRGFTAFELMLEEHPELHGEVVFLAVLQPSRQDVPEYAEYLTDIGAAATRVNARFGTGDWQPVDLRLASDMPLVAAAYRRCDVLMVNAVADGMNLVAKEAVLVNERDMVLALSEATGAHGELGRFALTLHPFDVGQQADQLHLALTMPQQQRRDLLEQAAAVVRHNDVARWMRVQLEDLAELSHELSQ